MIARAPGKLLLSGSYVVLEGAPALVTAVDRYVLADAQRPAPLVTSEVEALLQATAPGAAPPWFDATALRAAGPEGGRKLGVGSSAAILAASLGVLLPPLAGEDEPAWRARLLPLALDAHHRAQGGGSGVDVAASVLGGTLCCRVGGGGLRAVAHTLPEGVHIAVFAHATSASTAALLGALRALRVRAPERVEGALRAAGDGAHAAAAATDVAALVAAIDAQHVALALLAPEVPAILPELAALRLLARDEGATFAPSGAGGGDVSIFVGAAPPSEALRRAAASEALAPLPLGLGARGLHLEVPQQVPGAT